MKKIKILGVVFLALTVLSGVVYLKAKQRAKEYNPIRATPVNKIVLLSQLDLASSTITLVSQGDIWKMTSPIEDIADDRIIDSMLTTLRSFKLGTVVSENPNHYDQFRLGDKQALRIQVYTENKPDPILNGYVGGAGTGAGTSYFRFYGSPQVYLVTNWDAFEFRKQPEMIRSHKWLPRKITDATDIRIEGLSKLSVHKSSPTWSHDGSTIPVTAAWASTLLEKLDNIYVNTFAAPDTPERVTGFDAPAMKVTLTLPDKSSVVGVIGLWIPPVKPQTVVNRYAKADGRSTILLIDSPQYDDLITHLKSLK